MRSIFLFTLDMPLQRAVQDDGHASVEYVPGSLLQGFIDDLDCQPGSQQGVSWEPNFPLLPAASATGVPGGTSQAGSGLLQDDQHPLPGIPEGILAGRGTSRVNSKVQQNVEGAGRLPASATAAAPTAAANLAAAAAALAASLATPHVSPQGRLQQCVSGCQVDVASGPDEHPRQNQSAEQQAAEMGMMTSSHEGSWTSSYCSSYPTGSLSFYTCLDPDCSASHTSYGHASYSDVSQSSRAGMPAADPGPAWRNADYGMPPVPGPRIPFQPLDNLTGILVP